MLKNAIPHDREPEVLHINSHFFPPGFACTLLVGPAGSGKTQLLLALVPQLTDTIKYVFLVTEIMGNLIHQSVLKWCNDNKIKGQMVYTPDAFDRNISELISKKALTPDKQAAIIFDDFSKSKAYIELVTHALATLRNSKCHFFVLTQSITPVPTPMRQNLNTMVWFKQNTKSQLDTIEKDLVLPECIESDQLKALLNEWLDLIPHNYIFMTRNPWAIGAGNDVSYRMLPIDRSAISIPTVHRVLKDLGVRTIRAARAKGKQIEQGLGNDSDEM